MIRQGQHETHADPVYFVRKLDIMGTIALLQLVVKIIMNVNIVVTTQLAILNVP
jgi:hypothetical protein